MERQCFVKAATLHGIEAIPVRVEVSVGAGLPGMSIVGLPDSTVQESKLRIRSAIRAAGFTLPSSSIVINLAPSSVKKTGAGLDLPMAVGILAATGQIPMPFAQSSFFAGELSLDGSVRGTGGLLAFAILVERLGGKLITGQTDEDLSLAIPGKHEILENLSRLHEGILSSPPKRQQHDVAYRLDYADIAGNDYAKRALQICAAGLHGLLMVGPPGSGKTMLASRLPTIMPPLKPEERLGAALVHSVAGLEFESILSGQRPFRAPHHSASSAGLLGGGRPPTPGEVSLAHNGVLFLDEMPEFGGRLLQQLRQPVEDGHVVLARADGTYEFPANFLLVAAANPCPCGYLGDPERECRCAPAAVSSYQLRIGGPLMDRFDMMINVSRSDSSSVLSTGTGTSSAQLKEGVDRAREFAASRRARLSSRCDVEQMAKDARLVFECRLGKCERAFVESISRSKKLSGRAIMKMLSVARTIADMEESEKVLQDHIAEAAMYRIQDGGGFVG